MGGSVGKCRGMWENPCGGMLGICGEMWGIPNIFPHIPEGVPASVGCAAAGRPGPCLATPTGQGWPGTAQLGHILLGTGAAGPDLGTNRRLRQSQNPPMWEKCGKYMWGKTNPDVGKSCGKMWETCRGNCGEIVGEMWEHRWENVGNMWENLVP